MSNQAVFSKNLNHISSIEAAKQFGYTHDYISRLARERKIVGARVGRQWYVDAASLEAFVKESAEAKKAYALKLRAERQQERTQLQKATPTPAGTVPVISPVVPMTEVGVRSRAAVLARAGAVLCAVVMVWAGMWTTYATVGDIYQEAGVFASLREIARALYGADAVPASTNVGGLDGLSASDAVSPTTAVPHTSSTRSEGVVVVPPGDERSSDEIARTFSDEVEVRPDPDGKSGIIVPRFVHASATPYRYLMVPMEVGGSPP